VGVLHDGTGLRPEKELEDVDPEKLRGAFEVNAFTRNLAIELGRRALT
jgi:hypothetical protein